MSAKQIITYKATCAVVFFLLLKRVVCPFQADL